MVVGLIIRLSPGHVIREMLVSLRSTRALALDATRLDFAEYQKNSGADVLVVQPYCILQSAASANHSQFRIRAQTSESSVRHQHTAPTPGIPSSRLVTALITPIMTSLES
jgi:hypothetical protein